MRKLHSRHDLAAVFHGDITTAHLSHSFFDYHFSLLTVRRAHSWEFVMRIHTRGAPISAFIGINTEFGRRKNSFPAG
jgi:hypothetical protein